VELRELFDEFKIQERLVKMSDLIRLTETGELLSFASGDHPGWRDKA